MDIIHPRVRAELDDARDWKKYWAHEARHIAWHTPWERVYEKVDGVTHWYTGGTTNLGANATQFHSPDVMGRAAIISIREDGSVRTFTYAHLADVVLRLSRGFRKLGIGKGDRVVLYMPTGPEAICSMLALSRIGAIHMVVFAGFGAQALAQRIRLVGAKMVIASDVTWRKGRHVNLAAIVQDAMKDPQSPVQSIIWDCRETDPPSIPGIAPHRLAEVENMGVKTPFWETEDVEWMDSNDPAFILATSGTTAQPKLVVHTHGAYQVGIIHTSRVLFGLRPTDIWWTTSDIGWIVGHSFIVYAPLMIGATTLAYEGALDYPGPENFYRIIQEQHVTGLFTAPTAIRLLNRYGALPSKDYDLSSVERIFSAGEPLNPPAWKMFQQEIFGNRVPLVDHWWQTETGAPVVGNPYGLGLLPIKPGSAALCLPGYSMEIRRPDGSPCEAGEIGSVVITRPFPGLVARLWGDDGSRYDSTYWEKIPGTFLTGDAASQDEDGYFWFRGRSDEVLKIAGHRIGTSEVESALLKHPAVSEAGVTGLPDDLRGEVILAFVVLRPGEDPKEGLAQELKDTVRRELGPVAVIGGIEFVPNLPKTRSGKIMRRLLKSVVLGQDTGDISSIEDPTAVDAARSAWENEAHKSEN